MAYTFRLGFGLRPGLLLLWDVEGAFVEHGTARAISQTANLAALQIFADQPVVPEGGLRSRRGRPVRHARVQLGRRRDGRPRAYELIQGWNWSFDIEATVTGARYTYSTGNETWTNWSLVNFAINFF